MSRLFFLILGHTLLSLGMIGILLPILPTTPFLILACGCYGRSSEKFHQLLLNSPWSGPLLKNWQRNGSISLRAKCTALLVMGVAMTYSVVSVPLLAVKISLVLTAVGVSYYIITRPSPLVKRQSSAANPTG